MVDTLFHAMEKIVPAFNAGRSEETEKEPALESIDQSQQTVGTILAGSHANSMATGEISAEGGSAGDRSQQVGILFDSTDQLDAAIDWLWSEPAYRDLPRVHVGRKTMIVPLDAVDVFRGQGFQFKVIRIVSAGKLTPQVINHVRREGTFPAAQ